MEVFIAPPLFTSPSQKTFEDCGLRIIMSKMFVLLCCVVHSYIFTSETHKKAKGDFFLTYQDTVSRSLTQFSKIYIVTY